MRDIFAGFEQWATDLLLTLGYPGIALLVFLETLVPPVPSEVILPAAGFQIAEGRFSFPLVLLAATAGSLAGSLVFYGLGVWFGPERLRALIERTGHIIFIEPADLDRSQAWFDRHGSAAVFVARLIPGMRSLISLPAGLAHMPLSRFVIYTLLGSAIWNTLLVGLGWLLGNQWQFVGDYLPIAEYAVLAAILVVAVRFVWRRARRRRGGLSRRTHGAQPH